MFFSNIARSNIASRLRPWLLEEPDLEIKLGFLSSNGCAKNLAFDPSFLNPLIESCTRLVFKTVKVGELRLRLRPWSTPSILVEVLALHVILAPRETNKPQYVPKYSTTRKKQEVIASLDPEGASLHDAFEKILASDIPADPPMISWADVVTSCSQIKFQDVILELLETSHACLLKVDELSFESEFLHGTSLFRKFFLSLFVPQKGSGLSISCKIMKYGVKENDQIKWITSLLGLSAHVKLLGLHPMSNYMHVPSIEMKLTPEVMHLLPLILHLFSEEQGSVRTGKDMWRTAADKIYHLKLGARYSLQNAVGMVVLWLRYVYTYSSLLTVASKRNALKNSVDRKLIIQGKHDLVLISELEEKLPAQMVVQARRIARDKRFQVSADPEEPVIFFSTFLRKILSPFWLLWKIIFFIFQAVLHFSLGKLLNLNCAIHSSTTLDDVQSSCLSFEEILITCSHSDLGRFCSTKEAKVGDKLKLASFCLTLGQLCLIRQTDETKVSFFVALGEIKLSITASLRDLLKHDLIIKRNHSSKAANHEGIDESKLVLWGEPASLYSRVICNDDSLKPFGILLENDVRDLGSTWKKIRSQLEVNLPHKDTFLLGEIKHFLKDPYVKDGAYGLWKYCLNVGKICLDLDYSSILSGGAMLRQLDDHSQWTTTAGSMPTISSTLSNTVDISGASLENAIELYENKCVGSILNMIPGKDIQVGAVIAGLAIRLSLKDGFPGYIEKDISPVIAPVNSSHWLTLDIGNTEFVIWPASSAVLVAMMAESYFGEARSDYLWLKEPQNFDAYHEEFANDKFVSRGRIAFNACLRSIVVNVSSGFESTKHTHIVEPISITTQASICRDYHHTFYGTTDFHSVALIVISSTAAVLFYMDVLKKLFQLFEDTFLEVDVACNNFSLDDLQSPWALVKKSRDDFTHDFCSLATDHVTNLHNRVFLINATFDIGSVDIILGESRNTRISKYADLSSGNRPYLRSSLNKEGTLGLDLLNLPGFGLGLCFQNSCINLSLEAGTCDVLIDLSGLQAVLLDNQRVMIMSDDMCQMKDILSESLKQSYQFRLAHCRLKTGVKHRCGILGFSYPNNMIHSHDSTKFQTSCEIEDEISSNLDDADLIFESEYHAVSPFKRVDQQTTLKLLIFSGEGIHKIVCKLKGGCIILEELALTKFLHCFQVFSLLISNFPSRIVHVSRELSISKVSGNNLASLNSPSCNEQVMDSVISASSSKIQKATRWSFVDALTIDVTQFSVTLAVAGSYGKVEELIIEVDLLIRLVGFLRKIVVDLHRLTVLTQHLHKDMLNENEEMQMLHFSSKTFGSAAQASFETSSPEDSDCISDVAISASSMLHPTIENEVNSCSTDSSYYRHSILNHMIGFATIEKVDFGGDNLAVEFNSNWVGEGSISGLNLMIKLSQIQCLAWLTLKTVFISIRNFLYNPDRNLFRRSAAETPLFHLDPPHTEPSRSPGHLHSSPLPAKSDPPHAAETSLSLSLCITEMEACGRGYTDCSTPCFLLLLPDSSTISINVSTISIKGAGNILEASEGGLSTELLRVLRRKVHEFSATNQCQETHWKQDYAGFSREMQHYLLPYNDSSSSPVFLIQMRSCLACPHSHMIFGILILQGSMAHCVTFIIMSSRMKMSGSPEDANSSVKQNLSSKKTRWSADSDYKIPDGAIVAIQDLQQHMYFAVEPVETKYHLIGTPHYFLVGERALFKEMQRMVEMQGCVKCKDQSWTCKDSWLERGGSNHGHAIEEDWDASIIGGELESRDKGVPLQCPRGADRRDSGIPFLTTLLQIPPIPHCTTQQVIDGK
ncbi:hypothetical protein KSP40_PGU006440 [Platanthera guangdongensis]|uniref:Vacuolar protein sorting-associated protein 13 VPS13 adaptor binding domain-containing protein n=1 Tax=Platanthera guangdongensis TaxID=2320717 RepID=A0ABR2MI47_9ASPA